MDHVTNADARLRASSPPQLLPLIQTRRLRFFGHVARMGDSRDLSRALHMSTRVSRATQGLDALPRTSASHLASDPGSRPSAAQSWPELSTVTRPGQRMLEAACGNGYAPVRGIPMMMMVIISYCIVLYVMQHQSFATFASCDLLPSKSSTIKDSNSTS